LLAKNKNEVKKKKSRKQSQRVTELEQAKADKTKRLKKNSKSYGAYYLHYCWDKKIKKGAGLVCELGGGYLNTCKQFF
jgi:hypothetical protein